jgi:SAM-dependent methyltransferase
MIYQFSPIEKMLLKKGIIPQPLFDSDSNPALGRALTAAVKTGLTDQLSATYTSAGDLARKAGLNETVVPLVLDCLEALGYVKNKGDAYAFSKTGKKFLNRDSPANLINYLLFSEKIHYPSFAGLDEILQSGRRQRNNLGDFSPDDWKLFTLAMADIARMSVEEVTKAIPAPEGKRKLLDLGGSHGLYSIYQCRKNPALQAEILDMESIRPFLEQNIRDYNMLDQVSLVVGDFMVDQWEIDYDMIFAFNIVHGLNAGDNQKLFSKAHRSLKKGGILVIFDQIKDLGGKFPLSRAIPAYMGLNLYIQTGGRTYGARELATSLKQAGFSSAQIKKLRLPGMGLAIVKK